MTTTQEVYDNCKIEGNNVYLPQQLDRKLYEQVNKALVGIGGKWNRKEKAHVFLSDPSKLLGRVQQGEKINLKKEFQFFETPPELADALVELAFKVPYNIGMVLEPSAGQGAIVDALLRHDSDLIICCYELMENNRIILKEKYGDRIVFGGKNDFLKADLNDMFPTIVANPPFTKNQDIDHVRHMYDSLEQGGRLVSITSKHWEFSENKKESDFRNFLSLVDAEIINIDEGTFKSSGTLVGGNIIIINKK